MIYKPVEDSFLLAKTAKKFVKNKKVLDVGTGSGIQSINALDCKAKSVLATDINKESVDYVNFLGVPSLQSNLFSKIKGKFDVILFNPPYLPADKREDKESALATTGGKNGDEIILRFLDKAPRYLEKKGLILLVLSTLTPKERIVKIIQKNKMKFQKVAECGVFMEKLEVWKIEGK